MLVLTRKQAEQIQIGDSVVITILHVKGQSVRIGIEAPREVRVMRAELPKDAATPQESHEFELAAERASAAAINRSQSVTPSPTTALVCRSIRRARPATSSNAPLSRLIARKNSLADQAIACRANPVLRSGTFPESHSRTPTR